jgi:hypothetical protein
MVVNLVDKLEEQVCKEILLHNSGAFRSRTGMQGTGFFSNPLHDKTKAPSVGKLLLTDAGLD